MTADTNILGLVSRLVTPLQLYCGGTGGGNPGVMGAGSLREAGEEGAGGGISKGGGSREKWEKFLQHWHNISQ